jgi:hypothetical protein
VIIERAGWHAEKINDQWTKIHSTYYPTNKIQPIDHYVVNWFLCLLGKISKRQE